MKDTNYGKQISILDWLIIFALIIMFIMVYLPQKIWEEESKYKKMRRHKMNIISKAEEYYYELTGEYTKDMNELFLLVESAMDSLLADSLFHGEKEIFINNKTFKVNLEKDFSLRVDTTFSIPEKKKKTIIDSIYTIGVLNQESNSVDTFSITRNNLLKYKKNPLFQDIYSITSKERNEVVTNYLRRKYHLNDSLIYCPISKNNLTKKFIIEIDETNSKDPKFMISSPVNKEDRERRYGIFRYDPGKSEVIEGGVKSWAGN